MNETTFISRCCKDKAVPDEQEDGSTVFTCMKCEKDCEADEVCAYCLGSGEVSVMEQVYPGEPHMADVGTAKCTCQIQEHDGDGDDD